MTNIVFGGNSLNSGSIITSDVDMADIPEKDAKFFPLANANGGKIPFINYPSRTIRISGTMNGGSITGMDALLDTFKSYLNGQDLNLDIDWNGGTRRFIATVNATSIKRPNGLGYAQFEVEFICTDPFGQDTSTTTALNVSGRTTASSTDAYTFLGTAPYQLPIATITLSALTGGTNATVQWGNNTNGQAIFVTRTWTAGDVLVIDCVAKTVTVNGQAAAFSGAFPEFAPGAQTFQYADTLTTRTFNYNVVYTKRYL